MLDIRSLLIGAAAVLAAVFVYRLVQAAKRAWQKLTALSTSMMTLGEALARTNATATKLSAEVAGLGGQVKDLRNMLFSGQGGSYEPYDESAAARVARVEELKQAGFPEKEAEAFAEGEASGAAASPF